MIFPEKSRTRYIAHNPTGELVRILVRLIKLIIIKNKRKNRL
jgi:hypothetical protein